MAVAYLFIVRHGDTKANEQGIEAGPLPYPLSKKGRKEVSFIAETLSKISMNAVYTSPILRAVETAEIIAKPHDLKVKKLEGLAEAQLKPKFIGKKGRHHILTTPEAFLETNDDLLRRTGKAIKKIHDEARGNVVVVSHGDVITAMLENVIERRVTDEKYYVLHPDPASLSIVETKGRPFLVLFNYRRKLFVDFRGN